MESEPTETGAARIEATEETEATTYATLDEAIEKAKAGDTITLLADVKDAAIEITVSDLTLDLNGHTISGKEHPLSEHSSSSTPQPGGYTPAAITIGTGSRDEQGILGTFTLKNGTISEGSGLRIYEELETLIVEEVTFKENVASNAIQSVGGAAIHWRAGNSRETVVGSSAIFTNCQFLNNESNYQGSGDPNGGAVMVANVETISFTDCIFRGNNSTGTNTSNNSVTGVGGAVYTDYCGSISFDECDFAENTAASLSGGGAVFMQLNGTANFTNCTFTQNEALIGGAGAVGIYSTGNEENPVTISNCTFTENTAAYGGALWLSGSFVALNDNTLRENTASYYGGAMMVQANANVTLNGDVISNTASNGGAIYAQWGYDNQAEVVAPIVEINGNLIENTAETDGGAVYSNISYVTINGLVTGNTAGRNGGGVYSFNGSPEYYESKVDLTGASVYNNTAVTSGDDIYHDGGALALAPVGENWTLSGCGDAIDGWYQDGEGARWTAHTEPAHTEEYLVTSDAATGLLALKAAHGVIVDPEPSDPEPENPPYIPDPDPSEPEEPSEPSEPGEEISDPETPQTSFPGTEPSVPDAIPGEPSAPSTEEIPDEDTPQTAQPPQTGARAAGSIVLLAGAAAAAAVNLRRKRK